MVVIKVASSQVGNSSGYWPPALPDSIETIAVRQPRSLTRLLPHQPYSLWLMREGLRSAEEDPWPRGLASSRRGRYRNFRPPAE